MTKFLLLIYGDERTWAEASDDWQAHNAAGHVAFQAEAGPRVLAGGELQPAAQAVSLRPTTVAVQWQPTGHSWRPRR